MIEVFKRASGQYRWRLISEKGRTLYESFVDYPTDRKAHAAAKATVRHFSEHASQTDRAE